MFVLKGDFYLFLYREIKFDLLLFFSDEHEKRPIKFFVPTDPEIWCVGPE